MKIIPYKVTAIGYSAFWNNSDSHKRHHPGGRDKTIGAIAFGGCTSLTSVTIPEGVTMHWRYFAF